MNKKDNSNKTIITTIIIIVKTGWACKVRRKKERKACRKEKLNVLPDTDQKNRKTTVR